jgi:hypothetical protein
MNTDKKDIQVRIERALLERMKVLGAKPGSDKERQAETHYIAGAAQALQAVFEERPDRLTEYVPPLWIMYPMAGRSVCEELRKRDEV